METQRVDHSRVRTYEVRMNAQREFQSWLKFLHNEISEAQFYQSSSQTFPYKHVPKILSGALKCP